MSAFFFSRSSPDKLIITINRLNESELTLFAAILPLSLDRKIEIHGVRIRYFMPSRWIINLLFYDFQTQTIAMANYG